MSHLPRLGIGVGFRPVHFDTIKEENPQVDWFELITEHFLSRSKRSEAMLAFLKERYPLVLHGVSLAIGSSTPLDFDYLKKVKELAKEVKAPWISDHLSWGKIAGAHFHDLLPLPHNQEVLEYVAERARIVQDFLEVPFALENLSSYLAFQENEIPEWEFYRQVVEKSGTYMMLDVNNIYVSSKNLNFSVDDYLKDLPYERVVQIHLAGHSYHGDRVIDTHDTPVCNPVWELYRKVWPKANKASTLLEWDDHFLSFEETWNEALKAKAFQQEIVHAPACIPC
jgi:uncharacterized protein (UPF0276 family)